MSANSQERPTMMNCAMNMGAVLGLYYIGKFCLFPLSLHSTMAAMLFLGLTLVVPFLVYRLVKYYRDRFLGGNIDFARAFVVALLVMAFGSLLASVAHYVYFAYIDGGAMVGVLEQGIEQLSSIDLSALEGVEDAESVATGLNSYIEMMRSTAARLRMMSPIDMTMGMLGNNVSWAFFVALLTALLISVRRRK